MENLRDLFSEVKNLRDKKRNMLDKIRVINNSIHTKMEKKKEIAKIVKKNKGERGRIVEEIKKLMEKLKSIPKSDIKEDPRRIRKLIERLDWKIQTEVMPYKKEQELTKKIKELQVQAEELEKKYIGMRERGKIENEIKHLEQEKRLLHSTVISYSKQWKEIHSEIESLMEKKNELFKKMDEINSKVKEIDAKIDSVKKEIGREKAKRIEAEVLEREKRSKIIKDKINEKLLEVKEKFKHKKKLTKDDLMILQAADEGII